MRKEKRKRKNGKRADILDQVLQDERACNETRGRQITFVRLFPESTYRGAVDDDGGGEED